MIKRVYLCEDNVTDLFSAIYDAWIDGRDQENAGIALKGFVEQELFCEYVESLPSVRKAKAVEQMIRKHLGQKAGREIYYAALSCDKEKGTAIWSTMQEARRLKNSRKIMEHLSHPGVERVFELSRSVGNEAHRFLEFVRFRELQNHVLYAKIEPKNQVLTCIADHFADRLSLENWMIYDQTHEMCLIHQSRRSWFLLHGVAADEEVLRRYSGEEKEYERLWKGFCEHIAILERTNQGLQQQHLPLKYRKNIVEFSGKYS